MTTFNRKLKKGIRYTDIINSPVSILKYFVLGSLLLCFGACIGDKMGHCIPIDNVTLQIEYPDFTTKVHLINIGIFNEQGVLIQKHKIEKDVLQTFHHMTLTLDYGHYTALCITNTFVSSKVTNFDIGSRLSDLLLSPANFNQLLPIASNDSIHEGALYFEAKYKPTDHIVHLKPTFITLKMYIKSCPSNTPIVRINHVKPLINANLQPLGTDVSYYPIIKEIPKEKIFYGASNVFRFKENTDISIDILSNANEDEILYTVELKDFITKNHIVIKDNEELSIPILVEFNGDQVTVSIVQANWENSIITPEID